MADQHDAMIADAGKAGPHGAVVAEGPVAMQLDELVEDHVDVINRLRPILCRETSTVSQAVRLL